MFFVSLGRSLLYAVQSVIRNVWLSFATVTIVCLALLSVSTLGAVMALSQEALRGLEQRIDISVYLKPELTEAQVSEARTMAQGLHGVSGVELISADEALARFKERHQTNVNIGEALAELGENPLGATLIITAATADAYDPILTELERDSFTAYVQEARFDDYRTVISSVTSLSMRATRVGFAVSGIFLIIALLVVFNTIRMNIYTHREEISIMRLVGASATFIRAPFWFEGAIYAGIATLVTAAIFFAAAAGVQPYIDGALGSPDFNLTQYFAGRSVVFFGAQFVGATLLSVLASTIAMRRYLRV